MPWVDDQQRREHTGGFGKRNAPLVHSMRVRSTPRPDLYPLLNDSEHPCPCMKRGSLEHEGLVTIESQQKMPKGSRLPHLAFCR